MVGGRGPTVYNLVIFGVTVWVRAPAPGPTCWAMWVMAESHGRVDGPSSYPRVVQSLTLLYAFAFCNWQRFALSRRHRKQRGLRRPQTVKQGT